MGTEWDKLTQRKWRRRRWRSSGAIDPICVACEAAFNRPDTYYVRPAYTDGTSWLCAACFDRMKDATGDELDHRYGRRSSGVKQSGISNQESARSRDDQ